MVECPTCGKDCATENGMKNHHAKIHDESLASKIEAECNWCDAVEEIYESQYEQFGNWYCSRECYDEKQSERRTGMKLENIIGVEGAEKSAEKVSKRMKEFHKRIDNGEIEHPASGCTQSPSEETKQKISESLKGRRVPNPEWGYDEELDHFTRSGWEREFGRMLLEEDLEYEYEGLEVDMGDGHVYRPDFVLENEKVIVELKGRIWNDDASDKAEKCMEQFDEYTYVVIGSELPADYHLEWSERDKFVNGAGNVGWSQI